MRYFAFLFKSIQISNKMAFFDEKLYYGTSQDLGLRVCPFNSSHKIKDSKYAKHVLQCEQKYPKRNVIYCNSDLMDKTSTHNEMSLSDVKDNEENTIGVLDKISIDPSRPDATPDATSDARDVDNNSISNLSSIENSDELVDKTSTHNEISLSDVKDNEENMIGILDKISVDPSRPDATPDSRPDSRPDVIDVDNNSISNLSSIENSDELVDKTSTHNEMPLSDVKDNEENTIGVVDKISIDPSRPDSRNVNNEYIKSDETIDDENWNCHYKHYTLFEEKTTEIDDLNDDDIMQMAESFADIAVVTRMTKNQKKRFNDKLLEISKLKKERKLHAFNELITFRDECDPQLQDIPSEIRKPKVDIRQVFRSHKLNGINTNIKDKTKPETIQTKEIRSPIPETTALEKSVSEDKGLQIICGACSDVLHLNESNIKRMTVFCFKCSGFKFGGYFECHSCKVYGYFAKNQIEEHMSKHYHQNCECDDKEKMQSHSG